MSVPLPTDLEKVLGIEFRDKSLLYRAFIHRSFLNELLDGNEELADNERMEFLGDSVLSYIVSERLYELFPKLQEGDLTNLRSALVRRETLARVASGLKLGDYLRLGHGEEDSGGRTRPATLCATLEALIGAIYLDQGVDSVRRVVFNLLKPDFERIQAMDHTKDPKSRLQEYAQATYGYTPRYKVAEAVGPDHAKKFVMLVQINGKQFGVGAGRSKQEATQRAAAMALHRAGQPAAEYVPDPEVEQRYGFSANGDVPSPPPG